MTQAMKNETVTITARDASELAAIAQLLALVQSSERRQSSESARRVDPRLKRVVRDLQGNEGKLAQRLQENLSTAEAAIRELRAAPPGVLSPSGKDVFTAMLGVHDQARVDGPAAQAANDILQWAHYKLKPAQSGAP